jgi:radical SAM superfamily enzyme YgiQ (UPF0313 family)
MKVVVGYPPIESDKGVALLSQNRQFQYFNAPTYIYPMVPAYAATYLQSRDNEVVWMDGIAEGWSYEEFMSRLEREAPDLILMETKTPVVKRSWEAVRDLKRRFPDMTVVLCGDHVTWNPEETFANCPVDYILQGGDYDFLVVNLVDHLSRGTELEGGIVWREGETILNSGPMNLKSHRVDDLPMIDRQLTKWQLYAYHNGNYKYLPGTYTYAGRDCWWGKCTFCVWDHVLYPPGNFRMHSPERMLDEVGHLIDLGVKEIFDDCGTLPIGAWLDKFCKGMIERGYNEKVVFGCNMKPGHLKQSQYDLMGEAGFRFILYGIESGNQKTLDRLDKGGTVHEIEDSLRMAKQAGLEPHITVMIGYPWEDEADSRQTVEFAKRVFRKGYVDTLQGTIVVPYPGTPLFYECRENGWLLTEDWDRYDMRESVMKCGISNEQALEHVRDLYKAFMSPQYIARKVMGVRSVDDVKFLASAGKKLIGHLVDFKKDQPAPETTGDREKVAV